MEWKKVPVLVLVEAVQCRLLFLEGAFLNRLE